MMIPHAITSEYYAKWIGAQAGLLEETGMFWVYNPQRNDKPVGYPRAFDVYSFITQSTVIVSYGDRSTGKIHELKDKITLGMSVEAISRLFAETFLCETQHNLKYVYSSAKSHCEHPAKCLTADDYELYLNFFQKANPDCKDVSWVEEYFLEIVRKGYCHGVIVDNQLVSATDAPSVPFMSDQVQEIGINTLPQYRQKGYGKDACLACSKAMMSIGICPQWSTLVDNIASQKLAISVGFEKYFDNLSLCLS